MKFLKVAFLLALVATASCNNIYETLKKSKDHIPYNYNANASTSDSVNDILEKSQEGAFNASNDYSADDLTSASVNETLSKSEGRITRGNKAGVGQLPYQVFISILQKNDIIWCGGSLIGSEWVLSAAHCTIDALSVTVYLGSTQRYCGTSYTIYRNNIINHHSFDRLTLRNDISLIKIPPVSPNSPNIQPVKLPAISNHYSSYAGERVIVSGWGQTSDNNYQGTDHLQWARLSVITNHVCRATFDTQVTSATICISTPGGVSPCYGDDGGPLVLEDSKVQIGVNSFVHFSTCELRYPAGFTRITSYLDWIKNNTGIYYT